MKKLLCLAVMATMLFGFAVSQVSAGWYQEDGQDYWKAENSYTFNMVASKSEGVDDFYDLFSVAFSAAKDSEGGVIDGLVLMTLYTTSIESDKGVKSDEMIVLVGDGINVYFGELSYIVSAGMKDNSGNWFDSENPASTTLVLNTGKEWDEFAKYIEENPVVFATDEEGDIKYGQGHYPVIESGFYVKHEHLQSIGAGGDSIQAAYFVWDGRTGFDTGEDDITTPEPATMLILGLGVVGLSLTRRNRKNG